MPFKKYALIKFTNVENALKVVKNKIIHNEYGVEMRCFWSNHTKKYFNLNISTRSQDDTVRTKYGGQKQDEGGNHGFNQYGNLRKKSNHRYGNDFEMRQNNVDGNRANMCDEIISDGTVGNPRVYLNDKTHKKCKLHVTIENANVGESGLTRMVLNKFADIFSERDIMAINKTGPNVTFEIEVVNIDPARLREKMNEYLLPKQWNFKVMTDGLDRFCT